MNVYHITYSPDTQTACLYFLGCNFSCKGCIRKKNGRDIHLGQRRIKKDVRRLRLEEVIEVLGGQALKKVIFLGGEPSIDPEFSELARRLFSKYNTYNILITNGYNLPELEGLAEVCLSIKAVTLELHKDFTARPNRQVLENFKYLSKNKRIILRSESILIPGYIDLGEVERIAKFIARCNPKIPYRIDGYIPVDGVPWRAPTTQELIESVAIAKNYLQNVSYLGKEMQLKHKVVELF
jgi:pyruvate-formate lyase-activating enzyme